MRVLVTGGAGFIGHHLVRRLVADGDEVVVLDDLSRGSFERPELRGAELIAGDIREPLLCGQAVVGCDVVVHLAALSNVMGSQADPALTTATNVSGTRSIGCAARRAGVPHLIFASSREVYGEPDRLPVRESDPLRGKNAYGASKVAAEGVLRELGNDGPAVSVLRLTNVIGPGDYGRVVPLWMGAARAGQPMVLYGGKQVIDFVPVTTVVDAVMRLVQSGPVSGATNVGSGTQTTLLELASAIRGLVGGGSEIELVPAREVEVSRFQADVTRMREVLAIEPPCCPLAILEEMAAVAT
ncbi:MAG: NAD-dependent epimerase/dehydratase family protein [Tepidiformaceae bacterium]